MQELTEEQIDELRKALGIEEQPNDIDKNMLMALEGSYEDQNNTNKCDKEDYDVLKKKLEELKAKYGK